MSIQGLSPIRFFLYQLVRTSAEQRNDQTEFVSHIDTHWIAPESHVHALGQCQVAFVCQRRVHELLCIALILVRVVELRIDHSDHCLAVVQIES